MELIQIIYLPRKQPILLLQLGERNDKLCGLIAETITDHERSIILTNSKTLTELPLDQRLTWLRNHCPTAYRNNYREIKLNNLTIVSTHPINATRI